MADAPHGVTDPELRERLNRIQQQLSTGLESVDPHHRLAGRPMTYRVIAGRTFEIVFRDVTSITEAEILGLKRVIGDECYCSVQPQTAETLTVRVVVPLKAP